MLRKYKNNVKTKSSSGQKDKYNGQKYETALYETGFNQKLLYEFTNLYY